MITIYRIILENYHGDSITELYHQKENALARYHKLMKEGKEHEEFCEEESSFSFFDPRFNEYSTYIHLNKCELDSLFYD